MIKSAAEFQPAPSTLAIFPLASRRDLVRRSAQDLSRLHGEAATLYWRTTCRNLGADLLDLGCSYEVMHHEVMAFQDAVQMELVWLHEQEEAHA